MIQAVIKNFGRSAKITYIRPGEIKNEKNRNENDSLIILAFLNVFKGVTYSCHGILLPLHCANGLKLNLLIKSSRKEH